MSIVIGIDAGGTHTRVMAVDLSGNVRSFEMTIGISRTVSTQYIQRAIKKVVSDAGFELKDVRALVAGIKHLNKPNDQQWADSFTDIPGLTCQRLQVNDAVVAHAGALRKQPGIAVIGGTGSNIFGVTDSGKQLFIREFRYNAVAGAADLGLDFACRAIAGKGKQADEECINRMLTYFNVTSIEGIRDLFLSGQVQTNTFSPLAPFITDAAERGLPLASGVCNRALDKSKFAIDLMGSSFTAGSISVVLIGSVWQSTYMKKGLEWRLSLPAHKEYKLIQPQFTPVAGAAIMALESIDCHPNEEMLKRLKRHPFC
ncbi:BadF/BadG/BcrA/BcrD ATPase family protein [Bacillus sp. Marseille-P3661]|uniref:BadF/BadG/BcrA/BcrD ATPase family protein n=1 Tax=Bacillus sp. Marseille-P3661 TaxID=1936234 RepID=UPI000C831380|nr:BadF/BadG/BcrA/BcrD ATPase family protein [Bacillus sp. Marseille-P3661]